MDAETKMASLLGIECDEVTQSILDVMYANASYTAIQRAMHIHPAQQGVNELKKFARLTAAAVDAANPGPNSVICRRSAAKD